MAISVRLLKLFVRLSTLAELAAWQKKKLETAKADSKPRELVHITRYAPKRADELLAGGSINRIMSGAIVGRQRLTDCTCSTRTEHGCAG
jgi:hypothetical protein